MKEPNTLRILNLEDSPLDAELAQANLLEGGIDCELTRVQSHADFVAALEKGDFDLILSDYTLPSYDGISALALTRKVCPEVPFILLSGTLGEERAIESIKSGATDYVLKQRLERLVPAVRRALREAKERTERKQAEEALKKSEAQLQHLVRKLLVAQEEERRRVAYDLHDGLTQIAVATHQHLQAFAYNHPPGSKVGEGALDRPLELAQRTVEEARRVLGGLRPLALDDFGLGVAIRMQVEELERSEGWQIGFEEALGRERLPYEIETALYRVAQEALTNVQKHAQTKKACVKLKRLAQRKVRLEVRDEGMGFDTSSPQDNMGLGEGLGLSSMRERVSLLRGKLEIKSTPGRGTSVIAEVPLPASYEDTGSGHGGEGARAEG